MTAGTDLAVVPFHGAALLAKRGEAPGTTLVAMRPIVEGIGLNWKSQHAKLEAHPVLGSTVVEFTTVAEDGKLRTMTALRSTA